MTIEQHDALDQGPLDQSPLDQGDEGDEGDAAQLEQFVQVLTNSQTHLRAYLVAALGNYDDALEVLQRTNMVLWRNARKFRAGAEFMPWAVALARYEIMSFYRDRQRDRHVFTEEVAMLMLQTVAAQSPALAERQVALRLCVAKLNNTSQEMIKLRYETQSSIAQMAAQLHRTEDSIKSALLRVRKQLADCINKRLQAESAG